jgi:secreted trypsin-like serine protease
MAISPKEHRMRTRLRRIAGVLLLAALTAATTAVPAQAIYLGHDADIGRYPFMVSLRLANDNLRCTATLIEPDIVLAAAHCVADVPQGGLVAVVGADVPDWPTAPRVPTLGHRVPPTFDFDAFHDDIAVIRLAAAQSTPPVRLATRAEPRVGEHTVVAGFGCVNRPAVCEVRPTTLQAAAQTVLDDSACGTDVFFNPPMYGPSIICTKGVRKDATVNRGDSGGPLLVRDRHGRMRQVGVTALGADSTTKLYAGFTSIPVEAAWLASAIASLRAG